MRMGPVPVLLLFVAGWAIGFSSMKAHIPSTGVSTIYSPIMDQVRWNMHLVEWSALRIVDRARHSVFMASRAGHYRNLILLEVIKLRLSMHKREVTSTFKPTFYSVDKSSSEGAFYLLVISKCFIVENTFLKEIPCP